jgi:hypothetical protein
MQSILHHQGRDWQRLETMAPAWLNPRRKPVESLQRPVNCKDISPGFCIVAGFFAEKRNSFARFLKKAPCTPQAFWNPVCEIKQPNIVNH